MRHQLKTLVVAAAALASTLAAGAGVGQADAAPTAPKNVSCAPVPARTVDAAVRHLAPPFPGRDISWVVTKRGVATGCWLKWVQVYPEGATGSSPTHILFFDQDRFISTANRRPTAFTHVAGSEWPGEVLISYSWLIGDDATANPRGHAYVRFQSIPFIAPFPLSPIPPQVLG